MNIDILDVRNQTMMANYFDRVFLSNFFEHLKNKEELVDVLVFCLNNLKPGGSLLIIQPNFKYSFREYYDFIDHQLPITHISLAGINADNRF